jgi:hypothetical protein
VNLSLGLEEGVEALAADEAPDIGDDGRFGVEPE